MASKISQTIILLSVPLKEITLKGHFGLNLMRKSLESKLH